MLALIVHLLRKGLCSQGFERITFAFSRKMERTGSLKWDNIELKHTRSSTCACTQDSRLELGKVLFLIRICSTPMGGWIFNQYSG